MTFMALTMFYNLSPDVEKLINYYDYGLCLFFFLDFIRSVTTTKNKLKYLITTGWLDLISSIPTVDFFRYGRIGGVFKLIRLFRIYKTAKMFTDVFSKELRKNVFFISCSFVVLNILLSSVLVLVFESDTSANIKTPTDAIWWSIVTMTTVGYGDHYPLTIGGKSVAVVLMTTGISFFGVLTARISRFFIKENQDANENYKLILSEIRELRIEFAEVKKEKNKESA